MITPVQYGRDLARIHHEGFAALAYDAGPEIVRLLRASGIRRGLIVDLGCGSGLVARQLTASGYDVHGVDASPAMVRMARRTAPRAVFLEGRAEAVPLPACDAVVATGEAITYLAGRQQPLALLKRHIDRVSRALRPSGLFIFDLIVEGTESLSYKTWRASDRWAVLMESEEDVRRHVVTRRITTFVRDGRCYRRAGETHRVGVYRRRDVLALLRKRGFLTRTRPLYGAGRLLPRRTVFVAKLRS